MGSVRMSYIHVRDLLCTIFVQKPLVTKTFFKSFPKNRSDCESPNPDLELMRRIHPEGGFYGFMIRFWISPPPQKKGNIGFWIRKSGFAFPPQKNTPLV